MLVFMLLDVPCDVVRSDAITGRVQLRSRTGACDSVRRSGFSTKVKQPDGSADVGKGEALEGVRPSLGM